MIILDEKMPPPPPYTPRPATIPTPITPPPFPSSSREPLTLPTLGPHILLRIVYSTFSQTSNIEKQRKVLYWLTMSLRLVNRAFYVACMHVLRSTYLPAYSALVRPPYTSDPFPLSAPPPSSPISPTQPQPEPSPVQSLQRETKVLDLYIALKVREDVWADDTELHLERDESFRDLFDLMQPRARMEDLIRAYGARAGVVSISRTHRCAGKARAPEPIPFGALSVSFSSRRVGVVLTSRGGKRTIVQVDRARDERLEVAAKRLVQELKAWIAANS